MDNKELNTNQPTIEENAIELPIQTEEVSQEIELPQEKKLKNDAPKGDV